jgi:glutathione peroxidase-family protein
MKYHLLNTITIAASAVFLFAGCYAEPADGGSEKEETGSKASLEVPALKSEETPEKAAIGQKAPDFTLTDANGQTHSLSDFRGKHVVLEWINFQCPFVKKHYDSSNMQNLQETYSRKDVVWLTICSSAPGKQGYYSGQELRDRIAGHKMKSAAYLVDADGKVGRIYGAKTTPHMYVIDDEGALVYAGAIDSNPSARPGDIPGATNYVKAALDAALAGSEVTTRTTAPYGCSVKY